AARAGRPSSPTASPDPNRAQPRGPQAGAAPLSAPPARCRASCESTLFPQVHGPDRSDCLSADLHAACQVVCGSPHLVSESSPPKSSSIEPGRRLKPGDEVIVRAESMATDGRAVAAWGQRRLKIEGAIPGELVRARVFGRDKRTDLLRAVEAVEPSPDRV